MKPQDEPRQRLLEAAGEIFSERGFEAATVRRICQRANVNVAAVSYYFRDKEHLYMATVKEAACSVPLELRDRPWPADAPPADKLRIFIRTMLAHLMNPDKPAWHTRIMMRELAQPTQACTEWVRDYIAPTAAVLNEILAEMLPVELPRWKRFMVAFSIVGQCLYYLQNRPVAKLLIGEEDYHWFDEARIADHIAQFSLAALGVAKPQVAVVEE